MYRLIKVCFSRAVGKKMATSYPHNYLKMQVYTNKIVPFFEEEVYKLAQLEDIMMSYSSFVDWHVL